MRQLITRIDDRLHARLKKRAAAEGRSVNALVTDLLEHGLDGKSDRERLRAKIEALGLQVTVPPPSRRPPSRDAAIALTRGWGRAVSEALEADRAHR